MKFTPYILTFVLFCTSNLYGQVGILSDDPPVIGSLIELKADIDVQYDENNLPSHTVEWDSNDPLMDHAKYPAVNSVIIPTGCTPKKLVVKVRVIDWINRRIMVNRVTINIVESNTGPQPPPVVDPPPTDPDPTPDKWSGLLEFAGKAFSAVDDPQTARNLAQEWTSRLNTLPDTPTIDRVREAISEGRRKVFMELDKLDKNWNTPLLEVSKYIGEREPETAEEYIQALRIVIKALEDQ